MHTKLFFKEYIIILDYLQIQDLFSHWLLFHACMYSYVNTYSILYLPVWINITCWFHIKSSHASAPTISQTDSMFFDIIVTYASMHINIHKILWLQFCCMCVYDFRDNHFDTNNQLGKSSLVEAHSTSLRNQSQFRTVFFPDQMSIIHLYMSY